MSPAEVTRTPRTGPLAGSGLPDTIPAEAAAPTSSPGSFGAQPCVPADRRSVRRSTIARPGGRTQWAAVENAALCPARWRQGARTAGGREGRGFIMRELLSAIGPGGAARFRAATSLPWYAVVLA